MEIRYNRANPKRERERKKGKIKEMFDKEAKKQGVPVEKIDQIVKNADKFYNPYKYDNYNKWALMTSK